MFPTVTIRAYRPDDRAALERLAAIDSRPVPEGDLLLGEVDGVLLAAVRIRDGEAIADPFAPTADLVAMLRLQAARRRPRPRTRRILGWRAVVSPAASG